MPAFRETDDSILAQPLGENKSLAKILFVQKSVNKKRYIDDMKMTFSQLKCTQGYEKRWVKEDRRESPEAHSGGGNFGDYRILPKGEQFRSVTVSELFESDPNRTEARLLALYRRYGPLGLDPHNETVGDKYADARDFYSDLALAQAVLQHNHFKGGSDWRVETRGGFFDWNLLVGNQTIIQANLETVSAQVAGQMLLLQLLDKWWRRSGGLIITSRIDREDRLVVEIAPATLAAMFVWKLIDKIMNRSKNNTPLKILVNPFRFCDGCGKRLSYDLPKNKRYCNGGCRVKAHRKRTK